MSSLIRPTGGSDEGGLNLYAYADNDPVNETDPFGLQPSPQFEPWSQVKKVCGGRGHSMGCNVLTFSTPCTCTKNSDCTWSPNASINITNWQIFVGTNAPTSQNKILTHALGHASIHSANIQRAQQLASQMNGQRFKTKEACAGACTLFGNRAVMFMTRGHWWLDFLWQFGL